MIKKLSISLIICLLFISVVAAQAQEPARYNFATMQATKHMDISPGEEASGKIYFYNTGGNRITHVTLKVTEAPDNWNITILPPQEVNTYEVNGKLTNVTENFHIKPANITQQAPDNPPEGVEYIRIPGKGYAPARVATVKVEVPEHEEQGTTSEIKITAVAGWLGQTGTVAIKQNRDFTFGVKVVSPDYEEKIVTSTPGTPTESGTVDNPVDNPSDSSVPINYILIGIIVILTITILVLVAKKR